MISYRKLAMRVLGHSPVSAVKTARRSTGKRAAALALTAALVVGMTLPAFAGTWYIENGDIEISAGTSGNKVVQNGEEKASNDTDTIIKSDKPSTASEHTVTIEAGEGKTVDVTLENVNIDASSGAAVSVTGKGDTNIELDGNNTLTSGYYHAGLEHNKTDDSGTLTITDNNNDGKLTANGGYKGAGIGGGNSGNGAVTITGGDINANGGYKGAGIGGGYFGNGTVKITDGDINANGGYKGAGIGGGNEKDGQVTITGGEIIANGGDGSAGIGGGYFGNGTVNISGGTITEASGGGEGAGIGGGDSGNGTVNISGGTITKASGGYYGAGIGGGSSGLGNVSIEGNVTIKNAQGGVGAAGIGGGARGTSDAAGNGNKISIKSTAAGSPNITAKGGKASDDGLSGGAAIGSGSVVAGATEVKSDITIEGKVTINATGGGNVAIGDNIDGEKVFNGLAGGTNIKRTANGKDVTQDGDVVAEPEQPAQPGDVPEPEKPTETEAAEAPSTGSVEVERPVTVEGLYVTNVLGKQITTHLHPERHDPDHPRKRHRGLGPPDAGHGPHPEGSGREDPCVHHPALPLHHGLGGRPAGG